jgi:hypothetical protein
MHCQLVSPDDPSLVRESKFSMDSKMEGSKLFDIAEASPYKHTDDSVPKFVEVTHRGSLRVNTRRKIEHGRNRIHRLSHSGGSNGRTFDLEDIAAGSNGVHVTSTERACRVTVNIVAAKDLKKTATGPDAKDPVFKVRVEGALRKSKHVKSNVNKVCPNKSTSLK